MGFLDGKKALVTGIASKRSIAYGIAECLHREGAQLAFTYQNEKLKPRVEKFAGTFNSNIVIPLDVSSDEEIKNAFKTLKSEWKHFDILIHSIAFAPSEELQGT